MKTNVTKISTLPIDSLLGSINWLQSRTQFQSCYQFSRCASAAASPTIGDCKTLNKLCRQIVGDPMELMFWPLQGDPRLVCNARCSV